MFFSIQGYSYTQKALDECAKTGILALDVLDYQPLSAHGYLKMRKSLVLAERLEKAQMPGDVAGGKAKAAPAGTRWITVHPNGDDSKGVPVMIKEDGNGTAHVIGGAGGRLNMLKLNNIKSVDEYKALAKERREQEKAKREEERKQREIASAGLTPEEKKALREQEKARREEEKAKAQERKDAVKTAKQEFLETMSKMLGWEDKTDEIYENYTQAREEAVAELQNALEEGDDKERIKAAKKSLRVLDKGYEQALKSYEANMMAAAKDAVRDIQREAIADSSIKAALEERIGGKTGAEELIRTEKKSAGLGFAAKYAESAEGQGLTGAKLSEEKEQLFQDNLKRIAEEISPQTAAMIEKGVQTRRAIGEVSRELFERERLGNKVAEIDQKAEAVKQYIAYKKVLEANEEKQEVKALQRTIDGELVDDAEKTPSLVYGDGLAMSKEVSLADFTRELANEAARMETERQASVNSALLQAIESNPNGAEKWIANGHYDGFNRVALTVLKAEALPRDVSDVLGLRTSAQLLARIMRESMDQEAFADAAEAVQRFHADTSEDVVRQAVETSEELFKRADDTLGQIEELKADNPDDLAMLKSLTDTRIELLDEANRVLGQTLGSLEASAMLGSVMKQGGKLESVDTNMGNLSAEAAVVKLRALGLQEGDYSVQTVNGDRIATINESGISRLVKAIDPEEIAIERDVDDIKRGVYDEDGWLPKGLVDRPSDSFEDPGIDPELPEGGIDNQSFGEDAESVKSSQEAAHRTLGQIPEGAIAFKGVEELTASEQTDLRRYWENNIYKGSMAERLSERKYQQGEKGTTRAAAWKSFTAASGGSEAGAYEAIKADMLKRAPEDMFGGKETPAILHVNPDDPESYRDSSGRPRVDGAGALFDEIVEFEADIAAGRVKREVEVQEGGRWVTRKVDPEAMLAEKRAALPERLKELYGTAMRDHYHAFMSGISGAEYDAAEAAGRQEDSPWAEYVRMHGDTKRAQAAVLDTIKGRFIEKFSEHYGRVTKKPLATRREKVAEHKGHLLGMLGKEERDSVINKVQAELASAGASVANRAGGKFASGSWREKAIELIEKRRADAAAQGSFFGEEDLKQEDGTERLSIGKRAEAQLASMIPDLAKNQLRGQKYAVSTMQAKGERQRAIKMFARTKRLNLSFGTGKGKTVISIGAFTDLHAQGKAKRAIFAVPSVVQSQFGNEVNVFCEPGKYQVKSDPSLDRDGRIAAMKDPANHMCVMTHQSIRDDMVYLMSKRMGTDEDATKKAFNSMGERERAAYLKETLAENGISFDMLTVDEAHYTTNRKGKEDSTLSNVMDALNQNVEYFMNQTATPVKNDVSEAFDMLHKVAPERFSNRDEFIKRYGVDATFSGESLRRLINRYNYASPSMTGTKRNQTKETVQLSPAQRQAYEEVESAFRRASRAEKSGSVDVEAVKLLSPNSFKGKPEAEHEEIARRLQSAAGTIKEEALNRVVNTFDPENNAKISRLAEIVESKRYDADHKRNAAKKGDRAPGVVFAHNIASVEAIRSSFAAKGMRVGVIHGAMTGAEKDKVKNGFNPPNPSDRQYDVIVLSDAGATGLNLQNAKYLVNYDLPQTSWVKEQREGRIDRHGQAHPEIDYHDLVSDTEHEATKWERVQRKAKLGAVFQQDPGAMDDTGLASYLSAVRKERYNKGEENVA
jgi:hypothetical protein